MTALLAQHLLFNYIELAEKPTGYSTLIRVPINKIDGIKCDTFIYISKYTTTLKIETERTYINSDEEEEEYTPIHLYHKHFRFEDKEVTEELFGIILDKWFMDIGELKFDKRSSIFQLPNQIAMWAFLDTIPNVSLGDKCPVCYEMTANKLCCSHHICIPCLVELKPNNEKHILCPVCREMISHH